MALPEPITPPDALSELRSRLDQVDCELHRLMRERFDIVRQIGVSKGAHEPVIRPAREAAVIENRLGRHEGPMPAETLAHVFRVLIGAACAAQRPFALHVAGTLDAARYLYGPVPATLWPTSAEAVTALADRPSDVALIAGEGRWWEARGSAHVIARCATSDGRAAIAVGGAGVAPGTGPLALVVAGDTAQERAADTLMPGDTVLGRYHPFPLTIPVAA